MTITCFFITCRDEIEIVAFDKTIISPILQANLTDYEEQLSGFNFIAFYNIIGRTG